MSDIDRTRMIPLHIADQAVAACDAEIAKLREQIERMERTEEYLQNTLNRYALDDMRLQAHVEQLTKAGNNLVYVVTDHPVAEPFVKAWNAAKETKPHA
jgi:chromosome segregation ATPase